MFIYGAGGHAKVILDILLSQNIAVNGIIDDNTAITEFCKFKVQHGIPENLHEELIIGIGDNASRKKIAEQIKAKFGMVAHNSAIISSSAHIEMGTVIFHGSVIQAYTKIAEHVILNTACAIDHDCILEKYVHIAPHVTVCGNITIGEGSLIGAGAVIIPHIRIGKWCVIGAGSVIINDIPDYAIVAGNPARIIKYST